MLTADVVPFLPLVRQPTPVELLAVASKLVHCLSTGSVHCVYTDGPTFLSDTGLNIYTTAQAECFTCALFVLLQVGH